MHTLFKGILIAAGGLSLALGAMGIFIPVLPATPFLLLAALCFLRSSSALYRWLTSHKIFGGFIENYLQHKTVKKEVKIGSLIFLWLSLGVSILLVDRWHMRAILVLVGIGVSIHLLCLKTME